jgi:hypothetical protein
VKKDKIHFETRRKSIKRITLKEVLDSQCSAFIYTLSLLSQINDILPKATQRYLDSARADLSRRIEELDPEGKKQLYKYHEDYKNPKIKRRVIKHEEAAKLEKESRNLFFLSLRIPQFIREMSLVYLVTAFEVYLSDIVKLAFSVRKEMLRASERSITAKEAVSYPDLPSLLSGIIDKEVKDLLNGNVDEISNTLSKKFGSLKLEEDAGWQQFREYFYRRNIVVHNYGKPDSNYDLKTKSEKNRT